MLTLESKKKLTGVCFLKIEKTAIEARVADFTLVHIVAAYI